VRKPGAFARYRWREELFPSLVFRRAYDALRSRLGERADTEYVRILHLAASRGEMVVEQTLCSMLDRDERFNAERVQKTIEPGRPELPAVTIVQPDLRLYDALLSAEVPYPSAETAPVTSHCEPRVHLWRALDNFYIAVYLISLVAKYDFRCRYAPDP